MDLATLCTFVVSWRVVPNRVQFFQHEAVSLSCGDASEASEWTVMRNTSYRTNQRNTAQNKSHWFFSSMYYKDAGVYWCQSDAGECGAAVNITVTAGDVLLESPLLPVNEGDRVTFRCIWNPNKPRRKGTFGFFKDGVCVGNNTSGNLTIPSASLSDSGLYMCDHQGALSGESRLEVLKITATAGHPPQLHEGTALSLASVMSVVLPVSAASLVLLCPALVCLWRKQKEREKHDIAYPGVVIVQTPEPKRLKADMKTADDSTFYSTLQLNFM